jgi:hypothetical protein
MHRPSSKLTVNLTDDDTYSTLLQLPPKASTATTPPKYTNAGPSGVNYRAKYMHFLAVSPERSSSRYQQIHECYCDIELYQRP